jgi:hypothetical protein
VGPSGGRRGGAFSSGQNTTAQAVNGALLVVTLRDMKKFNQPLGGSRPS